MLLPTGPIDYITLNNLFLNGTLSPKTLVWNTDLEDWTEACAYFGNIRPPIPGTSGQYNGIIRTAFR